MHKLTWLHISDMHLHTSNNQVDSDNTWSTFVEHLKKQIQNHSLQFDLLFFTGDLAFGEDHSSPLDKQYKAVSDRLDELRAILSNNDSPLSKDRVYIIPGNHDLNHNTPQKPTRDACLRDILHRAQMDEIENIFEHANSTLQDHWKCLSSPLDDFRKFLTQFGYEKKSNDKNLCIFKDDVIINNIKLSVFGLNSAWGCTKDKPQNNTTINCIPVGAGWQYKKLLGNDHNKSLKIILIHHPLELFFGNDRQGAQALFASVPFLLTGHTHHQWITCGTNHYECSSGAFFDKSNDNIIYTGYNWATFDVKKGTGAIHLFRCDRSAGNHWVNHDIRDITQKDKHGNDFVQLNFSKNITCQWIATDANTTQTPSTPIKAKKKSINKSSQFPSGNPVLHPQILACDIIDFSELPGETQQSAVIKIWEYLSQKFSELTKQFMQNQQNEQPFIASLGDTVLIIIDYLIHPQKIRTICAGLTEILAKNEPKIRIRFAIYDGVYLRCRPHNATHDIVLGNSVNEARRLVSLGEEGTILVSNSLVELWIGHFDHKKNRAISYDDFYPANPKESIEIYLKSNIQTKIRLYKTIPNPTPPKSILQFDAIENIIQNGVLIEIADFFFHVINMDSNPKFTPKELGVRVSLFAPQKSKSDWLDCTGYRYIHTTTRSRSQQNGNTKPQRSTEYRWNPLHQAEGPLGLAFATNKTKFIYGLPKWKDTDEHSKEMYINEYNSKLNQIGGSSLNKEVISGFGRKAGAFFAIPVGICDSSGDAVLCIDTLDNLSRVRKTHLQNIVRELNDSYRIAMGLCWRLRVQL